MKTKGDHAPVNGLRIYYEIHGSASGTPLVLLHGGGSMIDTTFGNILPLLAKNRRVIAFDQQGHGRTADIDRPFSFEQSADDAAALLKYLKIEKADLLGFSNGGTIAIQIAIRHPQLVRKLIPTATTVSRDGMPPEFWAGFKTATLETMPLQFREAYMSISPHPDKLQSFFDKSVKRMSEFEDIPEDKIRAITVPALVIDGDRDVVLPEHAVYLFRLLANARLVILPSTHGGYVGEVIAPEKDGQLPSITARLVDEFLNEE